MLHKLATYITLFFTIAINSQSEIPCDLINISKLTVNESPLIKSRRLTIDNAEGDVKIQKSSFDYQFLTDVSYNNQKLNFYDADPRNQIIFGKLVTDNVVASSSLQKRFRNGLIANLGVDYSLSNDNFPFNQFNENIGANIGSHNASTTFSLTQPLLRGNSSKFVTALEKAAKLNLDRAKDNFELYTSVEVANAGNAYWQYLYAYKNLQIFKENEARVRNVLRITEELVKADKKPEGDLVQIRADLANQERQTRAAEQNLYSARIELGRVIGLSEEESRRIGLPTKDDFPTVEASGHSLNINEEAYKELASANRGDVKSNSKLEEALMLQLSLAKNNKRPQLDLTAFTTYGGMNIGNGVNRALASFTNKEGGNMVLGLNLKFSFPLNNNLARGNFIKNKVALSDQEINYKNLKRNIDLNVSIAINNLDNSVKILQKAKESYNYYQEVFNNEQIKFQNGLTTILNLIIFQERLTFSQLDYLRAQQQFASAIVGFRYETGTLLMNKDTQDQLEKNNTTINKEVFYTIPKI